MFFKKRLEDQSRVIEEDEIVEEITLEVKISKKGSKIVWYKNGKRLNISKGDKKYDLRESGLTSKLIIKQVKPEDLGVYKSTYAEDTTECTLRLQGKINIALSFVYCWWIRPISNIHISKYYMSTRFNL